MTTTDQIPLDVWLRFEGEEDEAEAEANTYARNDGFVVDWYLNSVGLVKSSPWFETYEDAAAWLTGEGFADFSS